MSYSKKSACVALVALLGISSTASAVGYRTVCQMPIHSVRTGNETLIVAFNHAGYGINVCNFDQVVDPIKPADAVVVSPRQCEQWRDILQTAVASNKSVSLSFLTHDARRTCQELTSGMPGFWRVEFVGVLSS